MSIGRIVPRSAGIYRIFRRYCDWMDGENNGNFHTNGEANFLRTQLPEKPVILDVGANRGEWTRIALQFHPDASIHSFEPIPSLYKQLTQLGFPSNVRLNQIALSSETTTRQINTRTASFERGESGDAEVVTVETLDRYCEKAGVSQIDFLKMDVEGHELAILKGARKMLDAEKIMRIQFEYSRCNIDARILLKDFFDLFAGRNYSFYKILPHGVLLIPEYQHRLENFKYKNFAVIHSSSPVRSKIR